MPGANTVTIVAAGDNFGGDAQFKLKVDGSQVGGIADVEARFSKAETQSFTFHADLTSSKQVAVEFTNDFYRQYGTNVAFDRNLYIKSIDIDGTKYPINSFSASVGTSSDTVSDFIRINNNGSVHININGYSGRDTIDKTAFGAVEHSPTSGAGQVYAVYDALLGRAPDPLGTEGWTLALKNGASLSSVAQAIVGSSEGQARLGAQDNATFVEQLYQSTLHRHSDPGGLASWTAQLNAGTGRADVALSFALSPEHISNLSSGYDTGFFVPDATTANVARLYYTVLGRAPDAAGLSGWAGQVNNGTALSSVTQAFLNSPEAIAKLGSLSDSQYVDAIYVNALGRHAEASGLASWTGQLANGAPRANVASAIGQSAESQLHHQADIEAGWHLL